jgi:hypothetical protein
MTEIQIGNIVAINSYPYENIDFVINSSIAGEPQHLPPLMVVTEILYPSSEQKIHPTDKEHPTEKEEILIKSQEIQYKCIWFSDKTYLFEETWLNHSSIKVFENNFPENKEFLINDSIIFKTLKSEIQKTKISLKQNGVMDTITNNTISGLVSYSSPIFQVIDIKRNEDKAKGKRKRAISTNLIKCKYHNYISDKFSEVILPSAAFLPLFHVPPKKLDVIVKAISSKSYFKYSNTQLKCQSILKPLHLKFIGGFYFLIAKDYLLNSIIEIDVSINTRQFIKLQNKCIDYLPTFKNANDKLVIENITKINIQKLTSKKYWRIRYKDLSDKISIRTIFNPKLVVLEQVTNDGEIIELDILEANCMHKNKEVRYFSIVKIIEIQVLELGF